MSGVFVVVAIVTGVLWKKSSDERTREKIALEAQARSAQEELDRLKREFDEKEKKVAELKRQMDSAKDEAERAKIEAQLAKAKKESEDLRGKLGPGRPAGEGKPAAGKPCDCRTRYKHRGTVSAIDCCGQAGKQCQYLHRAPAFTPF